MKTLKSNPLPFFLAFIFSFTQAFAQSLPRYSVGINAGAFIYHGDLTPWRTGSWKTPAFAWGLSGHRQFTSSFSARADLSFGKLRGNEARHLQPEYRQYRAFAFESRITELSLGAEWSPLNKGRKLAPYVWAGIGYSRMKIAKDFSRFRPEYFQGEPELAQNLLLDNQTALPRRVVVFPVGFGWKFAWSENVSLHAEAAHRFTRNDYLDGFSLSANPESKDAYTKYSVGIKRVLGNRSRFDCPPMRY